MLYDTHINSKQLLLDSASFLRRNIWHGNF